MQKILISLMLCILFLACGSQKPVLEAPESARTVESVAPLKADQFYARGLADQDMEQQIDFFNRAIELKPDFTAAYLQRGDAFFKTQRWQQAVEDYSKALELNPGLSDLHAKRGRANQKYGKFHSAIKDYTLAIVEDPQLWLFEERANCYKEIKRYELAIADYSYVLEATKNNAKLYLDQGYCYQKIYQYANALKDYQEALKLEPDNADIYYNIGSVYWVLSQWDEVITYYEKCLELNPEHSRVKQYLPVARKRASN
jgi:tetratricopeptide (TPR) repeat protein